MQRSEDDSDLDLRLGRFVTKPRFPITEMPVAILIGYYHNVCDPIEDIGA